MTRNLKWPESLVLIRHAPSAYNMMKEERAEDSIYRHFVEKFERNPASPVTRDLAEEVREKFALKVSDFDTPLHPKGAAMATKMARELSRIVELPDVIFVSPYRRTLDTLAAAIEGWPELQDVQTYEEERIREQEHGLATLYNDWRVFHTLHPDQRVFFNQAGQYWYQYPQGESVPMVRERNRSWITTIIREYAGKRVMAFTHHLTILSTRAQLERFDSKRFMDLDNSNKPINCGVTIYQADHSKGKNGKLVLKDYNLRLY